MEPIDRRTSPPAPWVCSLQLQCGAEEIKSPLLVSQPRVPSVQQNAMYALAVPVLG
jgi:hypothetical protein